MAIALPIAALAEEAPEVSEQAVPRMSIEVKDGLLSVDLKGAQFGRVISEIANQAGFGIELTPAVESKTISTSFRDIELERAILRMLNLIGEKNYSIHYGKGGKISKLEITGTVAQPASTSPAQKQPDAFPMRRAFPQSRTDRVRTPFTPVPERRTPQPPVKSERLKEIEEMMDEPLEPEDINTPQPPEQQKQESHK